MYWPVRNVAREGQQSGKLTKLFENVVPWAGRAARVRGMKRISSSGLVVGHHDHDVRAGGGGVGRPGVGHERGHQHETEDDGVPSSATFRHGPTLPSAVPPDVDLATLRR